MPAGATVGDALDRAAAQLQAAGIERARFEARLLLGQALNLSTEAIIADATRSLTADQLQAVAAHLFAVHAGILRGDTQR